MKKTNKKTAKDNFKKTLVKPRIIGLIPARFKSSRFPGKPLADIHGKPMIWWTYNQAKKSKLLDRVMVATEDEKIFKACEELDIPCVMTSSDHPTGTDRIAEAAKQIPADIYVNIQGDEPLMDPKVIDTAIKTILNDPEIQVVNTMAVVKKMSDIVNSNIPIIAVNKNNDAIYMSRLPIPFPKEPDDIKYYRQVCVYCFRSEALQKYASLGEGMLERVEGIELLRFIENYIPIRMVRVESENVAVDTPSDLKVVLKILAEKKKNKHM